MSAHAHNIKEERPTLMSTTPSTLPQSQAHAHVRQPPSIPHASQVEPEWLPAPPFWDLVGAAQVRWTPRAEVLLQQ